MWVHIVPRGTTHDVVSSQWAILGYRCWLGVAEWPGFVLNSANQGVHQGLRMLAAYATKVCAADQSLECCHRLRLIRCGIRLMPGTMKEINI